ncbi:TPA: hypothetical protein HA246_03675 [Candidatus Woesearchaeota archaeon]|nr:hypothetical protein [Candidatus Woesearchaeota archaeon]
MRKSNLLILFGIIIIMFLVSSSTASAALIGGRVYDYSLNAISNVNVEINTNPKQRDIAEQSVYAFNVPKGSYVITAKQYEDGILKASTTEQITVTDEGEYKLDLILFPDVSEDQNLGDEKIDFNAPFEEEGIDKRMIVVAVLAVVAIIAVIYLFFSKKRKILKKNSSRRKMKSTSKNILGKNKITKTYGEEASEKVSEEQTIAKKTESFSTEDADSKMVLDFIRSQEGRTTQKDIRKNFPSSEAKISLILTDLEAQGKIRKIKKGRGNVVVMN